MKKIRQLDMELAGGCNYSCEMCPQSSGREKEFNKLQTNVEGEFKVRGIPFCN